jgi:membrane protein DedA with SNARE-associated domain
MHDVAFHLAGLDLASLARLVSLVALPFAHEDLAIVLGAYIVVNDLMPTGLVVASIYGGMVVSDFALYGIGAGARRLPWLRKHAVDDRVRSFGDVLKRNLFALVALCRFIPGFVFVALVACGWAHVSLARFTAASLMVSAVYLAVMLYLVATFGDALDDHIGLWTWPLLLALLGAGAFARSRILAFGGTATPSEETAPPVKSAGLAALAPPPARPFAPAERIPSLLFRLPLALHWIALALRHRGLALPALANPGLATGGLWGESKAECLRAVAAAERAAIADFVVMRRRADASTLNFDHARALRLVADAGLRFPLVAKPDIGRDGHGVRLVEDAAALRRYLEKFPGGAKLILQRYVAWAGEAVVHYSRTPEAHVPANWTPVRQQEHAQTRGLTACSDSEGTTEHALKRGRILSLTLRICPNVVGDGVATLRDLVARDRRLRRHSAHFLGHDPSHLGHDRAALGRVPREGEIVRLALIGSRRVGARHRDASGLVTPALEARIAAIVDGMPDVHYARLGLRFGSLDALARGEDVVVIDVGGIGGNADDAWDPALPLREAWRRQFARQRLLFALGARNRARGCEPLDPGEFFGRLVRETDLTHRYPASS